MIKTLDNGLKVLHILNKGTKINTVCMLVKVGSINENHKYHGISHFLEHMIFKGSINYPSPYLISSLLENNGISYNAFTSNEYTGYYLEGINLNKQLEIISELYTNPLFDKEEIEREKKVVIEEINMNRDTSTRIIHENINKLYYPHFGMINISGTPETINNINQDIIKKFYKKYYNPDNSLLVIVSNSELIDINKYFKKQLNKNKKQNKKQILLKCYNPKNKIIKISKDTTQLNLAVSFKLPDINSELIYPIEIFLTILGRGFSSRLYQEIRVKNGYSYSINIDTDYYTNCGICIIKMNLNNKALKDTINIIKNINLNNITEKEIEIAKNYYIGNLYTSLETNMDYVFNYGIDYLLKNKIETIEMKKEKLMKVNKDDIYNIINQYFDFKNINICIIGNKKFIN